MENLTSTTESVKRRPIILQLNDSNIIHRKLKGNNYLHLRKIVEIA